MSPENKPTNHEPVEDINKAWAMAEAEDRERQRIVESEANNEHMASKGRQYYVDTYGEDFAKSMDEYYRDAKARLNPKLITEAGEFAGERYDRQQKRAETAKLVDSTTNDVEISLRGEPLGKKVSVIRNGLLDIESKRTDGDSDQSTVMSEEDLAQADATEQLLQNTFYNLARANPQLVPGLYLDSLTNYVGRKITEGQSLQDIMKNRRTDVKAHDILGQELAVLELLYRDLDITTPESEDRAWEAVVRSYDPQGKYFSPTQAIAEHGSYIDLGMVRSNFEQMLNEPDARDVNQH